MLVIGFDCETTGLDVNKDQIIEMGAVLWDTDRKAPLEIFSSLLKGPHIKNLEPRITELTGILEADLTNHGVDATLVLAAFERFAKKGKAIVAHNGNLFDRPIYEANCKRLNVPIAQALWVDTSCDIEFPPDVTTRRLKHLAAEHNFLNPFAHRALFDVLTMLKVTEKYDWEQIIRYAKTPTVTIIADTTFEQKELAKKLNYRWNSDKKKWIKSVKEFQLKDETEAASKAGFKFKVLKESENAKV